MSHVPAYVYLILALLLWLGIRRCRERRLHPGRLLIMPALMLPLGLRGFLGLFPAPGGLELAAALAGGALGAVLGWHHAGRWQLGIDRAAQRITVPGDAMMLVILLASFACEFALRHGMAAGAGWVAAPAMPPTAAALWSCFVGMSAGRSANLILRYLESRPAVI